MTAEKIIERIKKNGFSSISISVDKRNRAVQFYKRVGFKLVKELETDYTMEIKI